MPEKLSLIIRKVQQDFSLKRVDTLDVQGLNSSVLAPMSRSNAGIYRTIL
jgi:hypothetical protein